MLDPARDGTALLLPASLVAAIALTRRDDVFRRLAPVYRQRFPDQIDFLEAPLLVPADVGRNASDVDQLPLAGHGLDDSFSRSHDRTERMLH